MLSAAASPRWSCSFTPVRRLSGWSSISIAVMNDTNPPTVVSFAADWRATTVMMIASAIAAMSCTIDVFAAAAAAYFIVKRRTRSAASWNRAVS